MPAKTFTLNQKPINKKVGQIKSSQSNGAISTHSNSTFWKIYASITVYMGFLIATLIYTAL